MGRLVKTSSAKYKNLPLPDGIEIWLEKIERLESGKTMDDDLIVQTQIVSKRKAWGLVSGYWGNDEEMFAHFCDPGANQAAYQVMDDGLVEIKTDLSDRLTETCYLNVMLHVLYKAAMTPLTVKTPFAVRTAVITADWTITMIKSERLAKLL
jgi:hypothetical protein